MCYLLNVCMVLASLFPGFAGSGKEKAPVQHTIRLKVNSLQPGKGPVTLALTRNAAEFDEKRPACRVLKQAVQSSSQEIRLDSIPPGRYALAVFQDINANGRLDKNGLGIPTEPYGFSNGLKVKWRPPRFEQAAFSLESSRELSITIDYW